MHKDEVTEKIARYWRIRQQLEDLLRQQRDLDAELVQLERELPDDFDPGDSDPLTASSGLPPSTD